MKAQKHLLDFEDDTELSVGLVMCAKTVEPHEFFFALNNANRFCFQRKDDVLISGIFYDHYFIRFDGYDADSRTNFKIFGNKSIRTVNKKIPTELFIDENPEGFLLPGKQEMDYVITSEDAVPDFSLILLPGNLMFPIQNFTISTQDPFYNIIQYYE